MPTLRSEAGTLTPRRAENTSRSSIQISPASGSSKPAMIRRVVVLPQPEGPNRVVKSRSMISRSMLSITVTPGKRFVMPSSTIFRFALILATSNPRCQICLLPPIHDHGQNQHRDDEQGCNGVCDLLIAFLDEPVCD